jgi:hypothetical protein
MTPCEALAKAKAQMLLLASGQSLVSVETPQLGRVEFGRGSIADLQRLIDSLTGECAASLGLNDGTSSRRRPLSMEAWP